MFTTEIRVLLLDLHTLKIPGRKTDYLDCGFPGFPQLFLESAWKLP
jgi:hypothetical protein